MLYMQDASVQTQALHVPLNTAWSGPQEQSFKRTLGTERCILRAIDRNRVFDYVCMSEREWEQCLLSARHCSDFLIEWDPEEGSSLEFKVMPHYPSALSLSLQLEGGINPEKGVKKEHPWDQLRIGDKYLVAEQWIRAGHETLWVSADRRQILT